MLITVHVIWNKISKSILSVRYARKTKSFICLSFVMKLGFFPIMWISLPAQSHNHQFYNKREKLFWKRIIKREKLRVKISSQYIKHFCYVLLSQLYNTISTIYKENMRFWEILSWLFVISIIPLSKFFSIIILYCWCD